MLVQMISILKCFIITVLTIVTFIQLVVVDTHMNVQFSLAVKGRLTIWFQALVPTIVFGSIFVHSCTMPIQIFLKIEYFNSPGTVYFPDEEKN